MITLNLGDSGVPVPFQIDSRSECCVLPRHEYVRVTGVRSLAKLRPVKTVIVTYNGTREKELGQCKCTYTPILSLDASEGMGMLKRKDSDSLDYVYKRNN